MYDKPHPKIDTTGLEDAWKDGKLQVMPDDFYKPFTWEQLAKFGGEKGVYTFPTKGLIEFLGNYISSKYNLSETIEIGAGNGQVGRNLGIVMTDSHLHKDRDWIEKNSNDKTRIQYAEDVVYKDALNAVMDYLPTVILGSYIPPLWKKGMKIGNLKGVNEERLFDYGARAYIHIGNYNIDSQKPLCKKWKNCRVLSSSGVLYTISPSPEKNCLLLFER